MNILNQIESGNTIFTFLDGGVLQVEWIDTGGQKCFTHYQQVASDQTNWAEGVRAPEPVRVVGTQRGCSLALDYYQNQSGEWFLKNHSSEGGLLLNKEGKSQFFCESVPDGFTHQEQ
jgi:hypothetical protein